jgi:hypothetical protein
MAVRNSHRYRGKGKRKRVSESENREEGDEKMNISKP